MKFAFLQSELINLLLFFFNLLRKRFDSFIFHILLNFHSLYQALKIFYFFSVLFSHFLYLIVLFKNLICLLPYSLFALF